MKLSPPGSGSIDVTTHPPVAIVVLNWNNARDTVSCLDSLARLDYPNPWVIVVDNGSTDDSVAQIQATHPNVTLIETGTNLGYAGGNNVGVKRALVAEISYVCILNNDVTVEPEFLTALLAALHSQPDVGIVTPLVAEHNAGGDCVWALGSVVDWRTASVTRQYAGSDVDPWRGRAPFEVEIASGAAMLVRREVFEQVGLIDESFFLYFEEVDWSLKVRQAGYRILAVPSSVVGHEVSATLGANSPVIDYYMLRNHLRLIGRHCGAARRGYLWSRVVLRNLLALVAFTVESHDGKRTPNRNARLLAIRDALSGRWGKMAPDVQKVCHPVR